MRAELISVGTEILLGEITDTNSQWLAARLPAIGIDLYHQSTVGDNIGRLAEAIERALERSDVVIMTGGLGPTEDDLTREAIAHVLGEEMFVDADAEKQLRAFFSARGVAFAERNVKQTMLIPSARAIPNPRGTAPGWWVEKTLATDTPEDTKHIISMPGPPTEMQRMWEHEVAVAIMSKVHPVRSHSNAAAGGINAALNPDDSWESHAFDTVKGSDYLGDQDAIEIMCREAPDEVLWLEHSGVTFHRSDTGHLGTRAFGGASAARTYYVADITGARAADEAPRADRPLRGVVSGNSKGSAEAAPRATKRKRRKMSAAARKRMAEAQRKRWAEAKGQSTTTQGPPTVKRKLSAAGRKAIIAALKKRWALKRAEAAKQR